MKFDNRVTGPSLPGGFLRGYDADHRVRDVTIENIRFNGRDATAAFRKALSCNPWAQLHTTSNVGGK